MAGFTDSYENLILNFLWNGGTLTRETTLYFALFTTMPTADAGTGGTEVSGNNYSRFTFTNNSTNFPAASGRVKANGTIVSFAAPSGSWGTVLGWGLYNASTAGTLVCFGTFTTSKAYTVGDLAEFPIGSLTLTLNNTSGGIGDAVANKLLDHVFGGGDYTVPATFYATATTTTTTSSTLGTELTTNGFARKAITRNTTNFPTTSTGVISLAVTQDIGPNTTTDWGTLASTVIMSASSGGDIVQFQANTTAFVVGDTLRLVGGGGSPGITCTLD